MIADPGPASAARPGPVAVKVTVQDRPDRRTTEALLALLDRAAEAAGGTPQVSEAVLLDLAHAAAPRGASTRHLVARAGTGDLVGYAHVELSDAAAGPVAELVPEPGASRAGELLLAELERLDPAGRLRLWGHGRHSAAAELATVRGYHRERVLWRLRRPLDQPLPDRPPPAGVRLRSFVVGVDEPAWLELNNRAFAAHPDQSGWSRRDVAIREAEPWFDPAGFLLAERESDGALLGFHWTKVHRGRPPRGPVGEVYVLGVDPSAQGLGLGPVLTVAGLAYLRARGLAEVMLYADDGNPGAVRMYEKLGFVREDADVRYRRPAVTATPKVVHQISTLP